MHPKGRQAISGKLEILLRSVVAFQGQPQWFSVAAEVKSLAQDIVNQRKPWISHEEAVDLVTSQLTAASLTPRNRTHSLDEPPKAGFLWDFLGEETSVELVRTTVAFIESIPRSYKLLLRLPLLPTPMRSIDFTEAFGIVANTFETSSGPGGLLSTVILGKVVSSLDLCVRLNGYCSSTTQTQVARRGLSTFKLAYHQLMCDGLLRPRDPSLALADYFSHEHRVPRTSLRWIDETEGDEAEREIPLPLDASRLIANLEFSESEADLSDALAKGTVEDCLREHLRPLTHLLTRSEDDVGPIRSAMEWSFDASASENETIKFIQVSIGFEALLGEESESDGLTKALADRCAYLVAPNAPSRRKIRQEFMNFYKARSKIVHGRRSVLDAEERFLLEWGQFTLEKAIRKELASLQPQVGSTAADIEFVRPDDASL